MVLRDERGSTITGNSTPFFTVRTSWSFGLIVVIAFYQFLVGFK